MAKEYSAEYVQPEKIINKKYRRVTMKKKHLIILMSALFAASSLLGGCGNKDAGTSESLHSSESQNAKTSPQEQTPAEETPAGTSESQDADQTKRYSLTNLILRKNPKKDAKKLDILPIGTEVTVIEANGEWDKVTCGEQTGYVLADCLTADKAQADNAKKKAEAEQQAKAAADAAAKGASGDDAGKNSQTDTENSGKKGKKKIVSREDYPDCDGSGHGYAEITYSDGSTDIIEY